MGLETEFLHISLPGWCGDTPKASWGGAEVTELSREFLQPGVSLLQNLPAKAGAGQGKWGFGGWKEILNSFYFKFRGIKH